MPKLGNFPCSNEGCDTRFTRQADLQRHLSNVHERLRNFRCTACPKRFGLAANLKTHFLAVHSSEKPVACRIPGCDVRFGDQSARIRHEFALHAEPGFICRDCPEKFKRKENLKHHVITRHPGSWKTYTPAQLKNQMTTKRFYAEVLKPILDARAVSDRDSSVKDESPAFVFDSSNEYSSLFEVDEGDSSKAVLLPSLLHCMGLAKEPRFHFSLANEDDTKEPAPPALSAAPPAIAQQVTPEPLLQLLPSPIVQPQLPTSSFFPPQTSALEIEVLPGGVPSGLGEPIYSDLAPGPINYDTPFRSAYEQFMYIYPTPYAQSSPNHNNPSVGSVYDEFFASLGLTSGLTYDESSPYSQPRSIASSNSASPPLFDSPASSPFSAATPLVNIGSGTLPMFGGAVDPIQCQRLRQAPFVYNFHDFSLSDFGFT
ncbi:hypothetical protein FRB93_008686 [Tulasnella sp. JGI-2019a]|nr:hypothetical protein FRB93_008686 [Tulasnella sp. JGI-2019a]